MRDLLVLLLVGVGTYALRSALLVARRRPPAAVARGLRFVGPAVLAAIVVPGLLAPAGDVDVRHAAPALVAAAVAWLLHRRLRTFAVPLLGGMLAWWTLVALVGA